MNKSKLAVLCFLLPSINMISQNFNWHNTNYIVSYEFTFVTNPSTGEKSNNELYKIIGVKDTTFFVRYQDYYNDSLSYEFEKKYGRTQDNVQLYSELVLQNVARGSKSKLRVLKLNDVDSAAVILPKIGNYMFMTIPLKFKWEIGSETDTLLGIVCYKATTRYGGRDYIAWFTPEVPISDGPYVFKGLPGLILKIEDSDQLYEFTASGINTNPEKVVLGKKFLNPYNVRLDRQEYVAESLKMKTNPSYPPGVRNVTPEMKLKLKKSYEKRFDLIIEQN